MVPPVKLSIYHGRYLVSSGIVCQTILETLNHLLTYLGVILKVTCLHVINIYCDAIAL